MTKNNRSSRSRAGEEKATPIHKRLSHLSHASTGPDDAASDVITQRSAAGKQSVAWYLGLRRLGGVGEGPVLKAVISKNARL